MMAMMESLAIKKEDLYVEGFKSCSHSGRTHKDGTQNAVYSCYFTGFHGSQGFPHLLFPISLLAMIHNSSAKISYHLEKKEAARLTAVFSNSVVLLLFLKSQERWWFGLVRSLSFLWRYWHWFQHWFIPEDMNQWELQLLSIFKKKKKIKTLLLTHHFDHRSCLLYPFTCFRKKNCKLQETMSRRKRQCISCHRKSTVPPLCCFTSLSHFMALFQSNIVLLDVHSIPNSVFKCSWLMLCGCSAASSETDPTLSLTKTCPSLTGGMKQQIYFVTLMAMWCFLWPGQQRCN